MKRILASIFIIFTFLLSACSADHDAVAEGDTFKFVSPGGKIDIWYPANERKRVSNLEGPELTDQNKSIGINNFPNVPVVINVWAQWCGPCRSEANGLEQTFKQYNPDPLKPRVAFLGIDFRDKRQEALDFISNFKITYPSIFDPSGRVLLNISNFPLSVVPVTLILDQEHRVAEVFLRPITSLDLITVMNKLGVKP